MRTLSRYSGGRPTPPRLRPSGAGGRARLRASCLSRPSPSAGSVAGRGGSCFVVGLLAPRSGDPGRRQSERDSRTVGQARRTRSSSKPGSRSPDSGPRVMAYSAERRSARRTGTLGNVQPAPRVRPGRFAAAHLRCLRRGAVAARRCGCALRFATLAPTSADQVRTSRPSAAPYRIPSAPERPSAGRGGTSARTPMRRRPPALVPPSGHPPPRRPPAHNESPEGGTHRAIGIAFGGTR